MLSPHHLHATAAAWSLQAARAALVRRAIAEARQRGDDLIAAGPISSPVYGTRHPVGGHGDPVSATLTLDHTPARVTRWGELVSRLDGRLGWLARQIGATPSIWTQLEWVIDTLPALQPGTARVVHRHLADEDTWVRALPIAVPPSTRPLPGVACPRCGVRQLTVHCAGPVDGWTVTCVCLCVGAGCPCGMAGAVEGVAHIWPRTAVIGAVAGATPTRATN
ncbi:hypothetical protein ACFFMR_18965 [Micromonospora andamanensis]|uniref:Uncharacterized protein n=1 Tax=Micromonospora andamanensis TaxID=1287068 RepID=A0ABQ4HYN6_9ACTN|nr:hypothetical protein [Micromonospora andamanensis]GIJ10749.1 hypothetical protein Van01_39630 [Micromonospora andamanensis]